MPQSLEKIIGKTLKFLLPFTSSLLILTSCSPKWTVLHPQNYSFFIPERAERKPKFYVHDEIVFTNLGPERSTFYYPGSNINFGSFKYLIYLFPSKMTEIDESKAEKVYVKVSPKIWVKEEKDREWYEVFLQFQLDEKKKFIREYREKGKATYFDLSNLKVVVTCTKNLKISSWYDDCVASSKTLCWHSVLPEAPRPTLAEIALETLQKMQKDVESRKSVLNLQRSLIDLIMPEKTPEQIEKKQKSLSKIYEQYDQADKISEVISNTQEVLGYFVPERKSYDYEIPPLEVISDPAFNTIIPPIVRPPAGFSYSFGYGISLLFKRPKIHKYPARISVSFSLPLISREGFKIKRGGTTGNYQIILP